MTTPASRVSLAHIEEAAAVIDPLVRDSPQLLFDPLSRDLGARVVLKVETLNPIRSFKGRGADYFVHRLPDRAPLVAPSAGNFGQGLAYAARKRGIALTVFAAESANPLKLAHARPRRRGRASGRGLRRGQGGRARLRRAGGPAFH